MRRLTLSATALLLLLAPAASPSKTTGEAAGVFNADPAVRCLDEYGNIRFNDEKARLDNFAVELQTDPTTRGYILCYGGRVGRAGEARARCDRARDYVMRRLGLQAARVVTVDGGYREYLTVRLCVVPPGGAPPAAVPTVDPRDVKIIKPKPARKKPRPA